MPTTARRPRQLPAPGEPNGGFPIDGVSPKLALQFGYSSAPPSPQTDDARAIAGVKSRGFDVNARADEARGLLPAAPNRQEWANMDAQLGGNVARAEEADARRMGGEDQVRQGIMADLEMQDSIRRDAAIKAWEEVYGMPYSEKAAEAIAETARKNDEQALLMDNLSTMKGDMDREIADLRKSYPFALKPGDVNMDPNFKEQTQHDTQSFERESERIRQRYMLDMNQLVSVQLGRSIELGKQPARRSAAQNAFGIDQSGG